jgi:hypothetical protein
MQGEGYKARRFLIREKKKLNIKITKLKSALISLKLKIYVT